MINTFSLDSFIIPQKLQGRENRMQIFGTAATGETSAGRVTSTTSLKLKPDKPLRSGEPPSVNDYTDDLEDINE
jgi:hypothetical protein